MYTCIIDTQQEEGESGEGEGGQKQRRIRQSRGTEPERSDRGDENVSRQYEQRHTARVLSKRPGLSLTSRTLFACTAKHSQDSPSHGGSLFSSVVCCFSAVQR